MYNPDSNTPASEMETENHGAVLRSSGSLAVRAEWMEHALTAMGEDLQEDHFAAAVGHFREALCLSQGFPQLRVLAGTQAARQSEKLLPRNWRVAESLLREAADASPEFAPHAGLQEKLRLARYDEVVAAALYQADRAPFDGKIEEARKRLMDLLAANPGEKRLADRLAQLDRPARAPAAAVVPESDPKLALIKPDRRVAVAKAEKTTPWSAEALAASPGWEAAKNFITLGATTAMIGAAAFLVWHRFSSAPPASPRIAVTRAVSRLSPTAVPSIAAVKPQERVIPPAEPPPPPADETAWELVKTSNNASSIRSFLTAYPLSSHALRAKLRLASVEWAKLDKTNAVAMESFLRLHPRTPYRAEADVLIADLNSKAMNRAAVVEAVRVYRASQPDSASTSEVLEAPVIEGDKATVAGPTVTFYLVKADGQWTVESVR